MITENEDRPLFLRELCNRTLQERRRLLLFDALGRIVMGRQKPAQQLAFMKITQHLTLAYGIEREVDRDPVQPGEET